MYEFSTGSQLLRLTRKFRKPIWEIVALSEQERTGRPWEDIFEDMRSRLRVMEESIRKGLSQELKSLSGLSGGEARRLYQRAMVGLALSGDRVARAAAAALAVTEVNAAMGKIVAAPTAGSSGVIPGALIIVAQELGKSEEEIAQALFTAAGIGLIIAQNATLSGAEGGCQAEVGSASSMAAGALVELLGGTAEQCLAAASFALMNLMGPICDPLAGLVEIPCIKRNALGCLNAILCADFALAGMESPIPFDEVVQAMYQVGKALPPTLKETAEGGIAATPTAKRLEEQIFKGDPL